MANNNQRLIDSFDKNAVEKIQVNLQEYRGEKYLDLRVWVASKAGENGSEVATQKGLTLHCELIPDLIAALEKARDIITGKA